MKYKHNQNGAYALYEKNGEWRESASVRNEDLADWSKAPEDAEFYALGKFGKKGFYWLDGEWMKTNIAHESVLASKGFQVNPDHIVDANEKAWPDETRIDTIGSNGNTGAHYDEVLHMTAPSPKHDQGKARYDLLPPHALDEMALVLTFGANKYSAEGWRTVENARRRYLAAAGRHWQALLRGETHDAESGLHHAAHLMCCAAFIAELDIELE